MADTNFAWPDDCRAAVSLTFDDGLASQLNTAVPILNKFGVRGSFYVNPRDNYTVQLEPWKAVAGAGHEIGNHTVSHPCSKNFEFVSASGRRGLEDMAWEEIEAEIVEAGKRIREVIPDQTATSFAYPCYQPFIGRGLNRRSYVPLVAKHCVAGRGRGERANDPRYCDLAYLWSWPCERMTGAELVGLVEQAAAHGQWAIMTFHGIHEGHLAVSDGDFAELCEYLDANRNRVWTAPVAKVASYVGERQNVQAAAS